MVIYDGLERALKEIGIGKTELGERTGLSSRTIAKISKGERLSRRSIERIAEVLGKDPETLMKVGSDNRILERLREEKAIKLSGGLYHELQVRMTYHSNHIEGNRLSEEQTRYIYETNSLDASGGVSVDDILETVHHFRAIDDVIDKADEELTEEYIKHLHYILKHDTSYSTHSWFAVGEYKRLPNEVGGRETSSPSDVQDHVEDLLASYSARTKVSIEDIISFHAQFERIHPFQDGNGRVGRLIALKECLRHNIVPFLIEDEKKQFYYRGLDLWEREPGYLIDTCLNGQDTFISLLDYFQIPYE